MPFALATKKWFVCPASCIACLFLGLVTLFTDLFWGRIPRRALRFLVLHLEISGVGLRRHVLMRDLRISSPLSFGLKVLKMSVTSGVSIGFRFAMPRYLGTYEPGSCTAVFYSTTYPPWKRCSIQKSSRALLYQGRIN